MPSKKVLISLTDDLVELLDAFCKTEATATRSELIRKILLDYIRSKGLTINE